MIRDKLPKGRLKKFGGLLGVVAVLVMACPVPAAAIGAVVSIEDAGAEYGNTVVVPINIAGVTDLGNAEIWLEYNNAVVVVTDVDDGDCGALFLTSIDTPPGTTKMTALYVPGVSGTCDFAYITLHAVGSAGETSALHLNIQALADSSDNPIAYTPPVDRVFTVLGEAIPPTVTGTPTGSNVAVDTAVTATFSEAMDQTSAEGAFSLDSVSGSFGWVGNVMTFTPTSNLDYGTKYTATIAVTAKDAADNSLESAYSWSFTTEGPPSCNDGSENVAFVPNANGPGDGWLPTTAIAFSQFTFTNVAYVSVSAATLANYDTVVLMARNPMTDLLSSQRTDIVNWVSNGGKLIIYTSEAYGGGFTLEFSWIPYPFTVFYPGGVGVGQSSCPWVDLEIVEDNTLSSNDSGSPYYIDAGKIAYDTDAAGDQNVFIAQSAGWCGDMLGTNGVDETGATVAPGTTGYSHAYAHYDKGLFIYNGLDIDSLDSSSNPTADTGEGYLAKIWLLELEQTWDEFRGGAPCGLPCGTKVLLDADFTATPRRGMAALEVNFTDTSTGVITSWDWDFGDGATSTDQNPTHTYDNTGSYDVSLEVTGLLGSDTETKVAYITVVAPGAEEVGVLPPEPAKIGASYLFINPEQVVHNQWLEISANIYNKGGTKGTRTVALVINGYMADSQTVGVSPGASQTVVFRVRADSEFLGGIYTGAGTYNVNVEGMEGQFFVLAEPETPAPTAAGIGGPLGTGGIIAIVVIVILLIGGLMFVLRKE